MQQVTFNMEFLANVLGTSPDDLSGSLKTDKDGNIENAESLFKTKFQEKLDTSFRDGRKQEQGKSKKEAAEIFEREIAQKFGLDKTMPVLESIEFLVESAKKSRVDNPEAVKNSKEYLEAMREKNTVIKALEASIEAVKTEHAYKSVLKGVEAIGDGILKNYALPESESLRNNQKRLFLEAVKNGVTFKDVDGVTRVIGGEGFPLRDEMQNALTVEAYLDGKAKEFFPAVAPGTPGLPPVDPPAPGGAQRFVFSSSEDYVSKLHTETDEKARAEMAKQYEALVSAGKIV